MSFLSLQLWGDAIPASWRGDRFVARLFVVGGGVMYCQKSMDRDSVVGFDETDGLINAFGFSWYDIMLSGRTKEDVVVAEYVFCDGHASTRMVAADEFKQPKCAKAEWKCGNPDCREMNMYAYFVCWACGLHYFRFPPST